MPNHPCESAPAKCLILWHPGPCGSFAHKQMSSTKLNLRMTLCRSNSRKPGWRKWQTQADLKSHFCSRTGTHAIARCNKINEVQILLVQESVRKCTESQNEPPPKQPPGFSPVAVLAEQLTLNLNSYERTLAHQVALSCKHKDLAVESVCIMTQQSARNPKTNCH